jgi:hypothetical protein
MAGLLVNLTTLLKGTDPFIGEPQLYSNKWDSLTGLMTELELYSSG